MKRRKILKKKLSFHFYFISIVVVAILISSVVSSVVTDLTVTLIGQTFKISSTILIFGYSLIVGALLSYIISRVLLYPIRLIRKAMNDVTEGDFDVRIKQSTNYAEINDIYNSFNMMMDELKTTEILQSDFVTNVSHEFKTPLNAIEGYTTLLQNDNLTQEDIKIYTDKILLNTKRMSELVGNVLLLSKIDNQVIDSKKTKYSLDEQIRKSIVLLESKWSEKNIDLDIELDEIMIYEEESLFYHVWINLIDNAIKFSPFNGKITIRLFEKNDNIHFEISDVGPGIPIEHQKHIFDKFYQVDSSRKSQGNGLGLALVKKIVDRSDGEIRLSNLAKGCKVEVILNK